MIAASPAALRRLLVVAALFLRYAQGRTQYFSVANASRVCGSATNLTAVLHPNVDDTPTSGEALGFTFPFFGRWHSAVWINPNGAVELDPRVRGFRAMPDAAVACSLLPCVATVRVLLRRLRLHAKLHVFQHVCTLVRRLGGCAYPSSG